MESLGVELCKKVVSSSCRPLQSVHSGFRFSVAKRSNKRRAHFWMAIDGVHHVYVVHYSGVDSDAYYPTATMTVNVQLVAGQTVDVWNDTSDVIFGSSFGKMSWFTGFLLYEM